MPKVVHFEIPSDNPEKAVAFYKEVFGWKFQQWGTQHYWLATTGEDSEPGINGAIIKKNGPDHPVVNSIGIDDIDAVAAKITSNGCQIVVPKMAIPGVGWVLYFKDPDGNITGCHQNDPNAK